ncbi:hypothetical protein MesoLj113a_28080 [Mesorhizobium sp. 113-1-2]|uniref:glucoamylase family protein n=1 Tax=Mesorhizobium sp. 113-1-2 TaxID=2744515 RepID=UPI0019374312|nr:hypothetical protein MesoLj113a_28080 [Mesorhizobium sp. 113-1-2]
MSRKAAVERTVATLRFFWNSPHGPEPDATGHRGFYYHFLDMQTGRRTWRCELSTIDSTLLLAGVLAAATFFDRDTKAETEIRTLADALYRRADWRWALNKGKTVTHGWTPETGFLKHRSEGYDEALLLYVLGLGSPTHPLPSSSYTAWTAIFRWLNVYGHDYVFRMCGLIFAVCRTLTCAAREVTISADAPLLSSTATPWKIHAASMAMENIAGALPRVMARGQEPQAQAIQHSENHHDNLAARFNAGFDLGQTVRVLGVSQVIEMSRAYGDGANADPSGGEFFFIHKRCWGSATLDIAHVPVSHRYRKRAVFD